MSTESQPDLILVHGVFAENRAQLAATGEQRQQAFEEQSEALGVCSYEWVNGRRRQLANTLLRLARGTAPAVDAVEIIALDEAALREALEDANRLSIWQRVASCEPAGLDVERSFLLLGAPIQLLEGSGTGQRVLWFGNGLTQLSEAEFVSHYTTGHGPLVASHAESLGLRRYYQVPSECGELCESLRDIGMGRGQSPAVFAELVMGSPPLSLAGLGARRAATREIGADEKRHIDFQRSMLILAG